MVQWDIMSLVCIAGYCLNDSFKVISATRLIMYKYSNIIMAQRHSHVLSSDVMSGINY